MTDIAKEFFGISVKTATAKRVCVSCRSSAKKENFSTPEAYQNYKECGLCQFCQDELGHTVRGAKLNAFRCPPPLYATSQPRFPLFEKVEPDLAAGAV